MAERGTRWSGALVLAGVDEGPRSGVRAEFGGVSGADGRGDDPRRRWGGHKGVLKAGFNRRSQRIGHLGMRIGLSDRAALVQRQGTDMQNSSAWRRNEDARMQALETSRGMALSIKARRGRESRQTRH